MIGLPNPREEKINGLVFKKFPNVSMSDIEARWGWDAAFKGLSTQDSSENKIDEVSLAITYHNELLMLSYNKIEELYNAEEKEIEEISRKLIEEMEHKLFHQEGMKADFKYWNIADYWTVEECLSLTFGKDPRIISYSYLSNHGYYQTRIGWRASYFPAQYNSLLDLVKRSIESGSLKTIHIIGSPSNIDKQKVIPSDYINWATGKGFILPKELTKNSSDKTNYKAMAEKLTQSISDLEEENKALKKGLEKKENKRIINTLYKIICGLVKKHYPTNQASRISMIQKSISAGAGINIDDKTLRTHIEEALTHDLYKKEKE